MKSKDRRKAQIVALLSKEGYSWNELQDFTGSPKSTLSNDLSELVSDGILNSNYEVQTLNKEYIRKYIHEDKRYSKIKNILDWWNEDTKSIEEIEDHIQNQNFYGVNKLNFKNLKNVLQTLGKVSRETGSEIKLKSVEIDLNVENNTDRHIEVLEKLKEEIEVIENV